jgi:hypothetical protein
MNPRYLPAYVKKKKYSKFPSHWIQKNGVYVNPSDTRKYPFPITTISPVDYEYEYDVDDPNYWGIINNETGIESIMNMFSNQNANLTLYNEYASPIEQFVKVLLKKKRAKIHKSPTADVIDRMFVIKITLEGVDDNLFYRVVELPASISLAILHDKVISSVVGWCRGYHGYVFIDLNDGAVLGPEKNDGYIDRYDAWKSTVSCDR